ncbi:Clp protease N-terminal domain-containing protein [Streptoalloteichus hindustanus]|uniref:ATP-dependent Clp protease ATP-binding subunit ClpC n=1 Tax=Streptoalloteichus hindustanus TaxID=2017 RepID=A0A1M5MH12_STRHI|nr:Clp protease N-terminal domain-containing protein [Streptoalloteichus hindustanus]SHG76610.1 ATP-dependent Clp protease ATP-binding subunit ClpC [Streptoalloteichus hindustanus]
MPKINVYLPDDLAEAVKDAGVPVSAICQRALEQAVRRVTAIREAVLVDLDDEEPVGALAHFTPRTRTVLKLAVDQARQDGAPRLGTEHLLGAMLAEGTNLALHVLRAMDIDPERVARELDRQRPAPREAPPEDSDPRRFDGPAANALEMTVTEATSLGHNYVGCEHLLLGLAAEPDGVAGQVLRALGADARLARRAVTAALAGYVHLRAQGQQAAQSQPGTQGQPGAQGGQPQSATPAGVQQALAVVVRKEIEPLNQRIARLEEHLNLSSTQD